MDGRFTAHITRPLTFIRTLVYNILGIRRLSAQPNQVAVPHAFDIFIAIAYDAVLGWTQANRTSAVVKFVPVVSVASVYVHVDPNLRHISLTRVLSLVPV
jgi:hypothetical protein